MLLAIDTATPLLSIALHDGDGLLAEFTLKAGRRHGALLAPQIKRMMAQCGLKAGDLKALAVSVGPGSYTGTRVGVALAKGMAAASALPLLPVTTLETVLAAQPTRGDEFSLIAAVSAGRSRVIWAEYRLEGAAWLERRAPQISDWATIVATIEGPARVSGEISAGGREQLRTAQEAGAAIELAPAAQGLRRAGYLAEIAWGRLRGGDAGAFPADRVMPVYLQGP